MSKCIGKAEFAKFLDHTILNPVLGRDALEANAQIARKHNVRCLCVRPYDVSAAVAALQGTDIGVITVIGFPLGISKSEVKAFEAEQAIADGAAELDMVINIPAFKSGDDRYVTDDIRCVVGVSGEVPVKVIIETCCLSDEEKVRACKLVADGGAKYVKTSTGFGTGGATTQDISLIRRTVGAAFGVKASGGVRTFETAVAMIDAGASRLGVTTTEVIMEGWQEGKLHI